MATRSKQTSDESVSREKDPDIPDLLEQLDMLSSSLVKDGGQVQASSDPDQAKGEESLEDMVRLLHKQLKSSGVNNSDNDTSTKQQLTIDLTNSSELGQDIPDLLEQLDRLAPPAPNDREEKQQQCQASSDSAEGHLQASGDSAQCQGGESLEDMLRTLHKQIKTSDWLQENTAEKWVTDNPQLAKDYMEAMDKS